MAKQYFVFFKDLVTQAKNGIMRKEDKKKLDGIDEGANKTIVDTALNKTSKNPVENKVIATEIENLKKSAGDGKNSVASAVTQMGIPTATDADFPTIAENIKKIGGDANITAGDVLSGKTAYAKGKTIVGTMPNNGAKTAALNCGEYYIIPAGYHNGAGRVSANSLVAQTPANAAAADILSGKTAYVNGSKVTGDIPSKTAATYTPTTTDQEITAGQYLSGKQTIKGDVNLIPANIKKGVSIFGVSGNMEANKTQVMLGNILTSRFSKMQNFERSLADHKKSLGDSAYAYWYSSSLFEHIDSFDDTGINIMPSGSGSSILGSSIHPLETYILFETGECLRLYMSSGKKFEWLSSQPTSFNVKVFWSTQDTLTFHSIPDEDRANGATGGYTVSAGIVASRRVGFYIIPLAMGGAGYAGPSYVSP